MSRGKIVTVANGQIIKPSTLNSLRRHFLREHVPRNADGAASPGQSLGTATYPWLAVNTDALYINGDPFDPSLADTPPNALISGAVRSTSTFPAFLDSAGVGGGLSADLLAATTDLIFKIRNEIYSATTDIVISGLTAAPTSNNTATVNESVLGASTGFGSRFAGDRYFGKTNLTISSAGSEITDRIGQYAAFYFADSDPAEEYFIARIESATLLSDVRRGFFFTAGGSPIVPAKMTNSETITLMSLHWVFLDRDGTTIDTTLRTPFAGAAEPAAPESDDYWFDSSEQTWKRYSGTEWQTVERIFVGWLVADGTDCVAHRPEMFYSINTDYSFVRPRYIDASNIGARLVRDGAHAPDSFVFGNDDQLIWASAAYAASTENITATYASAGPQMFLYIGNDGEPIVSDIAPFWWPHIGRYLHPYNTWQCVGHAGIIAGSWQASSGEGHAIGLGSKTNYIGDSGLSVSLASFTVAGGATQAIAFDTVDAISQSLIYTSTPDIYFRRSGWFWVAIYMQIKADAGVASDGTITIRFFNSYTSVAEFSYSTTIRRGAAGNEDNRVFPLIGFVQVRQPMIANYRAQVLQQSGSHDLTVTNARLIIKPHAIDANF